MKETLQRFIRAGAPAKDSGSITAVRHSLILTAVGQIWLRMKETLQRFIRAGAPAKDSGMITAVRHNLIPTAVGSKTLEACCIKMFEAN